MIKYYLTLLALYTSLSCFSQQEKDSIILPEDKNEALINRSFQENLGDKYVGDDFNYQVNTGESQNFIKRFLNWVFKGLDNVFGFDISPQMILIIEYIIYTLMGILALYLLIKFLVGENLSTILTKKAKAIIDINLSEEHIEYLDLETLLKDAIKDNNYRLAVRYQYLKALKALSQNNIIEWQYEKTNADYQKEITTPKIKAIFKDVSYAYDYIWYGEQPIDQDTYKAAAGKFSALKNLITQ